MTCTIERTHKKDELHYRFREYARWSVSANHYGLAGFRPGKLTLMDQQKPICVAAQRMAPRQFWGNLPLINMFVSNPYIIVSQGRQIGTIYRPSGAFGYVGEINDIPYEYRLHSHYVWSLIFDKRQIAVVKYRQGSYIVQISDERKNQLGFLLLLCACFDRESIHVHPHIGTNFIPRDKYASRAFWQPEEK